MPDDTTDGGSPHHIEISTDSDSGIKSGLVRGTHSISADERSRPPPVGSGQDKYPTPVDYLLFSLTSCQVSVLAQCLSKARVDEFEIGATADIADRYNPELPDEMPQKFVIENITIDLDVTVPEQDESRAERCLEVYDQGCIVGQTISNGVDYQTETQVTIDQD